MSYANTVFQSILHVFLGRFTQNLFSFKSTFVHCLKVVWLIIRTWMKGTFSWMKNTLFCTQFSPQKAGNCISYICRALKFQNFLEEDSPRPPLRYGINSSFWIQLGILFKPAKISFVTATKNSKQKRNK